MKFGENMVVHLKNFVNISDFEKKLVWKERNKESIRLKMYNSDIIPFNNHIDWVNSLKNRNDCKYFLVYFDEIPMAVLNYVNISKGSSCELGSYIFEEYLNTGYGIPLGFVHFSVAFEQLNLKEVYCSVLESNSKVYKMNIKVGYKQNDAYTTVRRINGVEKKFDGLSMSYDDWFKRGKPFYLKYLKYYNFSFFEIV